MKRASNVQLGLTSLFKAKQSVFHVLQTSPQLLMEQWRKKTALVKIPYSLFLSHSNHLITFATTLSQLVNSLICLLVSQLTVQLVRTAHRTERALYVRLELINLLRVSRPAFLVVKI